MYKRQILVHGVPVLHHFVEHQGETVTAISAGWLGTIVVILLQTVIGILAGIAALLLFSGAKRLFGKKQAHA